MAYYGPASIFSPSPFQIYLSCAMPPILPCTCLLSIFILHMHSFWILPFRLSLYLNLNVHLNLHLYSMSLSYLLLPAVAFSPALCVLACETPAFSSQSHAFLPVKIILLVCPCLVSHLLPYMPSFSLFNIHTRSRTPARRAFRILDGCIALLLRTNLLFLLLFWICLLPVSSPWFNMVAAGAALRTRDLLPHLFSCLALSSTWTTTFT